MNFHMHNTSSSELELQPFKNMKYLIYNQLSFSLCLSLIYILKIGPSWFQLYLDVMLELEYHNIYHYLTFQWFLLQIFCKDFLIYAKLTLNLTLFLRQE